MDFITTLSNIEGICRSCYTLSYFTVPTIYLPIIAVLPVTYDELLRLILQDLFSDAKPPEDLAEDFVAAYLAGD